jgi:hypothetical protein
MNATLITPTYLKFAKFYLDLRFTEVIMNSMIFWVVTLCSSIEVHLLSPSPRSKSKPSKKPAICTGKRSKNQAKSRPAYRKFLLGSLFGMFLWNVDGLLSDYTVLRPRKSYSSMLYFKGFISYLYTTTLSCILVSKHEHICILLPLQLLLD